MFGSGGVWIITMTAKPLIVAGSHKRENSFSYPVLDALIEHFGRKEADYILPVDEGAALDLAEVWSYDPITLARIQKEKMEGKNHKGNGCFLHDMILDVMKHSLVVDIHSFHIFDKRPQGTGMDIFKVPNVRETQETYLSRLQSMEMVLDSARRDYPECYGHSDENPVSFEFLESVFGTRGMTLMFGDRYELVVPKEHPTLGRRVPKSKSMYTEGMLRTPQYYLFEAVNCGENAQRALTRFIIDYLVPNSELFLAK